MASADEQPARPRKRFYVQGQIVPFEEDHTHEFKGHRNLTMEDIPPWAKVPGLRSRGPISRVLNAFLNTGDGGTVYLGIIDDGKVQGLNLTQYMKDHVKVSLDDVLQSYTPPVEPHRYRVKFVPVVEASNTPAEIDEILSFDSSKTVDPEDRMRPHVFRTHNYCWCDKDCVARFNLGTAAALYVIEITIRRWDPNDKRNKYPVGKMRAHPVHTDEAGRASFRRQASVVKYTPQEVLHMSKQLVANYYQPRIKELQRQIQEAKDKSKYEAS